jgi:hypothetical protein
MSYKFKNGNVVANCPDCGGAMSTFERLGEGREFGSVIRNGPHSFSNRSFSRAVYILTRCAGCGRGGLATVHDTGNINDSLVEEFFPFSIDAARLPSGVPAGIEQEFREAERCASFGAWRAASALLRSTLEKTLKANGYTTGSLAAKIDGAGADGVITEARKKKAHEEIRVLGNDVLHDEWQPVTAEDVEAARHFAQRILEDFYDDRASVVAILSAKNRLPAK